MVVYSQAVPRVPAGSPYIRMVLPATPFYIMPLPLPWPLTLALALALALPYPYPYPLAPCPYPCPCPCPCTSALALALLVTGTLRQYNAAAYFKALISLVNKGKIGWGQAHRYIKLSRTCIELTNEMRVLKTSCGIVP